MASASDQEFDFENENYNDPAELDEEARMHRALADSLLEGDIDQYEAGRVAVTSSPLNARAHLDNLLNDSHFDDSNNNVVPVASIANSVDDEALAMQLQSQLNKEARREQVLASAAPGARQLALARTPSEFDRQREILAKKTYSGSYFGKRGAVTTWFTYSVMFLCCVLMLAELLVNRKREGNVFESFESNPLFGPSTETLLFLGAKRTDLIVDNHEAYRLFMPIILHGGILHLVFNMLFLLTFGTSLEHEFGHAKVAYIFLTSGFIGVLCSAIFNPTIPSVGASGACFGLIGATWADLILNFGYYRTTEKIGGWVCQLLVATVINLCIGLVPQLDNFAHIGGFIAGIFTGLTVLTLPRFNFLEEPKPQHTYQIVLKIIALILTPLSIVVLLIVLYTGVDVLEFCPWCLYLNCVPTPWWSCAASCSEGFSISFEGSGANRTVVIDCPRDIGTKSGLDPGNLEGNDALQLALCQSLCLGE